MADMPNTKSAEKTLRASARKRVFNVRRLNTMKEVVKNIRKSVSEGDIKKAQDMMPEAYKTIDKSAKQGIIKKNTAARKKSRLSALIKKSS